MQIQSINKLRYNYNFQRKNKVVDDGDYVKIPKEKYQRDKILGNILGVWLLIEMIPPTSKLFKWLNFNNLFYKQL